MGRSRRPVWLPHLLTLFRLLAALLFASIAFQDYPPAFAIILYAAAAGSDLIDGYVARKYQAASFSGQVLDLISDKSLTIVSLLYAAACGISIFPLAVIATRELVSLGLRMIVIDGRQLWPTSRFFGGVLAACMWGDTLFLYVSGGSDNPPWIASRVYWLCAVVLTIDLTLRVGAVSKQIKDASEPRR
jgi:phosphatidylglycerophosphate synthase